MFFFFRIVYFIIYYFLQGVLEIFSKPDVVIEGIYVKGVKESK